MQGRTLLLLLRAGDRRARRRVLEVLERRGGDVQRTAAELAVSRSSLYRLAAADAGFGAAFRERAQGLAGARRRAAEARQKRLTAK